MHFSLRTATCWLLLSILTGVLPGACATANAAAESGRSGNQDPAPQAPAQQAAVPVPAVPAPQHHHAWKWLVLVGVVAVGAGVAIIATNRQSGHTATTTPSATVGVGSATPGAPH